MRTLTPHCYTVLINLRKNDSILIIHSYPLKLKQTIDWTMIISQDEYVGRKVKPEFDTKYLFYISKIYKK